MKRKTPANILQEPEAVSMQGEFYHAVSEVLRTARTNAYRAVNFAMVEAYWNIGRLIVEEAQQGRERAEYGAALLKNLSLRLSAEFGSGFSEQSLRDMRQFFACFQFAPHCGAN